VSTLGSIAEKVFQFFFEGLFLGDFFYQEIGNQNLPIKNWITFFFSWLLNKHYWLYLKFGKKNPSILTKAFIKLN